MSRQLVLAHFSIRDASFVERAAAARAAGFDGIGLYVGHWSALRHAGRTDAELLGILAEHETRVIELEALRLFADAQLDTFVHLVATYRPDRLQVVPRSRATSTAPRPVHGSPGSPTGSRPSGARCRSSSCRSPTCPTPLPRPSSSIAPPDRTSGSASTRGTCSAAQA